MAINKASLIKIEANQLPDATIIVSPAISLSRAEATKIPKILGLEVRVVAIKTMAIKAMVVVMVKSWAGP